MSFSSANEKYGMLPATPIMIIPSFFTDLMAVPITSSEGAKTVVLSKSCSLYNLVIMLSLYTIK
jgi:hypothetical protein